ncbi:hypothetical protein ABTX15_31415, partial [Micromonospora sp. NPDC094482]|uniref:hypothetical protein n=1 Tax=Micromonospora sp. NPDC094482 TaxID=3155081 RepID=UPI003320E99B
MVERGMTGGSCINVTCIPTKALVTIARLARQMRDVNALGAHAVMNDRLSSWVLAGLFVMGDKDGLAVRGGAAGRAAEFG